MNTTPRPDRRDLLTALAAGAGLAACATPAAATPVPQSAPAVAAPARSARKGWPVLIGSNNALPGMKLHYEKLLAGADPLDVAIEVIKLVEADPDDESVGIGGLPNEEGVVQLDAACMHGPRHKSGAVACIENILHPSEVAKLVLERTDHCLLVGKDAYRFARSHGHEHVELLTESARKKWMEWKETMSTNDDRLPPPPKLPYVGDAGAAPAPKVAVARPRSAFLRDRVTGTIHVSGLGKDGSIACCTSTSGLAWKIPGRVGDSPIIGSGLYCDQEAGSAGATGRGEASILAQGSFAIVEMLRRGATPHEAGMEALARVVRQTRRQARWQPDLLDEKGDPSFNLMFYVLALDGTTAGVALRQPRADQGDRLACAVATPDKGPHLVEVAALLPS